MFLGCAQATEALRITGGELQKLNVVDQVIKVRPTHLNWGCLTPLQSAKVVLMHTTVAVAMV